MEEHLKTLLLNSSFEVLSFIHYKRVIKLILNKKVEILDNWESDLCWVSGKMKHPAVVRLNYHINMASFIPRFNRKKIFSRDFNTCQYCLIKLTNKACTLDHIIPLSRGGKSGWLNCVTACSACNLKKSNKLLSETNMLLVKTPKIPFKVMENEYSQIINKHPQWDFFVLGRGQ